MTKSPTSAAGQKSFVRKWWALFLTGAVVAIAGLIIGLIFGLRSRDGDPQKSIVNRVVSRETSLQEVSKYTGHTRSVRALAVNPSLDRLYSASEDGTVIEWAVNAQPGNTTTSLRSFRAHTGPVLALALTSTGETLFSGGVDGIWVHNLNTTTSQRLSPVATSPSYALAIGPSGTTLFSGSDNGTVRQFDITTGEILRTYTANTSAITAVVFNAINSRMYSGSADAVIEWSPSTGALLRVFKDYFTDEIVRDTNALALTSNGILYAATSLYGVPFWDTSSSDVSGSSISREPTYSLSVAERVIVQASPATFENKSTAEEFRSIVFRGEKNGTVSFTRESNYTLGRKNDRPYGSGASEDVKAVAAGRSGNVFVGLADGTVREVRTVITVEEAFISHAVRKLAGSMFAYVSTGLSMVLVGFVFVAL